MMKRIYLHEIGVIQSATVVQHSSGLVPRQRVLVDSCIT